MRLRRLRPALLVAITVGLTTTVTPVHGAEVDADATRPSDLLPVEGALFGAYPNFMGPDSPEALREQLAHRETQMGRRYDIHHMFFGFEQQLVDEMVIEDVQLGRIPMLSWFGTNTRNVRLGVHDEWIRTQARSLRDVGGPVLLRWGWEAEAARSQRWSLAPWEYIQAYRRIVRLFRDEGAFNVEHAWVPMSHSFANGDATRWYPGDTFVDWIGADGYNWAPGRPGYEWISFRDIFAHFYAWAAGRGKPLIIAEYGAQERATGEKAAWLLEVDDALKLFYPDVDAVVYFDTRAAFDWRVNTSSSSLSAFAELGMDPYLNTRPPT